MNPLYLESLIVNFLNEDLGLLGDLTSTPLPDVEGRARLVSREAGVLCGAPFFERVFKTVDPNVSFKWLKKEGERFKEREELCRVEGSLKSILTAERTALNLLQRLSGVATRTREFVKELEGYRVKLLDTRKTTPGLRLLEKYATRVGGALNHRIGLYDAVMVKDNHIRAFGGVKRAVEEVAKRVPVTAKVEVEIESWEQLEEVISVLELVDIVMLDNWPLEEIEGAALKLKGKKPSVKVEVSGGIDLESLRFIRELPVDFVSTSKPVTSAKWIDLSLEVE